MIIINDFSIADDFLTLTIDVTSAEANDYFSELLVYVNDGFSNNTPLDFTSKLLGNTLNESIVLTSEELGFNGNKIEGIVIGFFKTVFDEQEDAVTANLIPYRLCILDKIKNYKSGCDSCNKAEGYNKDDVYTSYLMLEGILYSLAAKEYVLALDFYNKISKLCYDCDAAKEYVAPANRQACTFGIGDMAIERCFIIF